MGNLFQKCAVAAVGAGFSLIAIAAKPVQAATMVWGLKFFQQDGTEVGSGEFSYNPDKTTFIETTVFPAPLSGFYVRTLLDSFSADILGAKWELNGIRAWWADDSTPPGRQIFSRYSTQPTIIGFWLFGNVFLGYPLLTLDSMQPISDDVWKGTWSGSAPGFNYRSGVWTATRQNEQPVPEPTFPLGLLVFGVLGTASALKLKHKQQESVEK